MKLADFGWCWEGQGLDPGVDPSILGVGDGCRFFGLTRANYMFHPNTEFAMRHMAWLDEVTCDIAKWGYVDTDRGGTDHHVDAAPETVLREARRVSELSVKYPNIVAAFHDDMLGLVRREGMTPEQYSEVYDAVRSQNPALRLWVVVYTHELEAEEWDAFDSFIDVVHLWIWNSEGVVEQDAMIRRCRERFPDRPLIMGCYLRDYPKQAPVEMSLIRAQWDSVLANLQTGAIDGFSILSGNLIDGHLEQARYIRDLIAANS